MVEMKLAVQIEAPKEKVWTILWHDATLREWMEFIDHGSYMLGELKEGSTVQFNSAEGYGVTSLVAELRPNEYVAFQHRADTKDNGENSRDDQWTGGNERYKLTEVSTVTTLEVTLEVPPELERIMARSYPKAFDKIKEMAENN